jgi:small conductance mechanosensitive channel
MVDRFLLELVSAAALVVVSGALFWALSGLLRRVARVAGGRPSTDRAIRDTTRALWLVVAVGGSLYIFQLASEFSVLTASAVGGLVVSLALQTTLSNMISGIFLLYDRVVSVGDVIEYSGTKGRVVKVALRNTWMLTDQGLVAVIGNSALAGGPLVNHSASARFARKLADDPIPAVTAKLVKRLNGEFDAPSAPSSPPTASGTASPTTTAAPPQPR